MFYIIPIKNTKMSTLLQSSKRRDFPLPTHISVVILTYDLEVQGHIVFSMVDYVCIHLKIEFLKQ